MNMYKYNSVQYIEFLNNQLILVLILGIILVLLFAKKFASSDSSFWKPEYGGKNEIVHDLGVVMSLLSGVSIIYTVSLWIGFDPYSHYIDDLSNLSKSYEKICFWLVITAICTAIAFYCKCYRPSPRSNGVKTRKIIAYLIIISIYGGFAHQSVTSETLIHFGYTKPVIIGILVGYGILALIAWLLLRHYKNEKYIPYCEMDKSHLEIDNTLISNEIRSDIKKKNKKKTLIVCCVVYELTILIVAVIVVGYLYIRMDVDPCFYYDTSIPIIIAIIAILVPVIIQLIYLPSNLKKKRIEIKDLSIPFLANKKRLLAYYLIYIMVLFIIFITLIVVFLTDTKRHQLAIPIILFLTLIIIPFGVYWILKTLKESEE